MRPLAYFEEWTARDRGLAEALLMHESSTHRCGHDLERATNPDMDGWYEVDPDTVCYACAALQQYEREHKEPEPGVLLQVVDKRPADLPLPGLPQGRDLNDA